MSEYADIKAHFESDVRGHQLILRRDEAPFRHIEFVGHNGLSRIVLISWPYNLLVAGSHGSFHFERFGPDTEDMFNWLRGVRVSPDSWTSKLINGRDSVTKYDPQRLKAHINELVAEAVKDGWAPDGLEAAVRKQILDSHWMDEEQNALRLVSEFQLGMRYRAECSCGESAEHDSYSSAVCWNALTHKGNGDKHKVKVRQSGGFTFDDFTEWNWHKLDYHYVYQCHAAVWAVAQYDAARKAEPVFFVPGRTYTFTRTSSSLLVEALEFQVSSVSASPRGDSPTVAFGWCRDRDDVWQPFDTDDFEGWTEAPAAEAAPVQTVELPA